MTEKGFEPLTSQLGIAGTSYRLQVGLINDQWASRILKGKNVIDSYVYKDVEGEFPNQNRIVGWVIKTVAIPNINPHQIMKTTSALVKQAKRNKEERKVKAPLSETKDVELEKVPEKELKRPKAQGWVKDKEAPESVKSEEEKRQAFRERMKAKKAKAGEAEEGGEKTEKPPKAEEAEKTPTAKTSRELPSIPSGKETEKPGPKKQPKESKPKTEEEKKPEAKAEEGEKAALTPAGTSVFCPYCGKDLGWNYCPYCGEKLPHAGEEK
ncbi:MAG: hypothetical protein R6U96_02010 [Promethearchaeia archaeon]